MTPFGNKTLLEAMLELAALKKLSILWTLLSGIIEIAPHDEILILLLAAESSVITIGSFLITLELTGWIRDEDLLSLC